MQVIRMGQDQFIYTVQKQSIHFGVTVHEHFPKQIQNNLPNFKLSVKFCACSIQCKQQTCNCSGVNMFPSDKYVVRLVRPSFRSPQCVDEQYRIMVSMSSINRWLSSLFLDPFHDPDWTEKKKQTENMNSPFHYNFLKSLTSFRLYESKLLSEQTDDASLSSDSSRDTFRFKFRRPISDDGSKSSGDCKEKGNANNLCKRWESMMTLI